MANDFNGGGIIGSLPNFGILPPIPAGSGQNQVMQSPGGQGNGQSGIGSILSSVGKFLGSANSNPNSTIVGNAPANTGTTPSAAQSLSPNSGTGVIGLLNSLKGSNPVTAMRQDAQDQITQQNQQQAAQQQQQVAGAAAKQIAQQHFQQLMTTPGNATIHGLTNQAQQGTDPYTLASSFLGDTASDNKDVLSGFFKKQLGQNVDPTKTPWCAAFANSVLKQGGFGGVQGNTLSARNMLNYGKPTTSPTKGDLAVFSDLTGNNSPVHGHVGFYAGPGDQDGYIKVLGGNQSGSVSIKQYPASKVLGYRTPTKSGDSDNQPPAGAGAMLPGGANISSQSNDISDQDANNPPAGAGSMMPGFMGGT